MKRVTGTHLYTFGHCAHAVTLDFHGDPEQKRGPTEVEEFVLRRGRELEDRIVAELGFIEPEYPTRDFDAGATATHALLREGVAGVSQGVLLDDARLGIPDLLRREPGDSDLGAFHYVVGDIKSSARPRGDQLLQVLFYSRMLGALQGRAPDYGYLVLRDGREERFVLADYAAVLDEVEHDVLAQRAGDRVTRPFLSRGCAGCRWSEVCLPELAAAGDLSLLQGMTPGLRSTLSAAGVRDCEALAAVRSVEALARRTHIEATALRRLRRAAQARVTGMPQPDRGAVAARPASAALVHLLGDPFAERIYWIGVRYPATPDGETFTAMPSRRDAEVSTLLGLLERVPVRAQLWHYGGTLPRWFEDAAWRRTGAAGITRRMVDLQRRLRGAAVLPGPSFGLDDHVRMLVGSDPLRAGDRNAVGLWVEQDLAGERLPAKGAADLDDLCALLAQLSEQDEGGRRAHQQSREGTVGSVARAETD